MLHNDASPFAFAATALCLLWQIAIAIAAAVRLANLAPGSVLAAMAHAYSASHKHACMCAVLQAAA